MIVNRSRSTSLIYKSRWHKHFINMKNHWELYLLVLVPVLFIIVFRYVPMVGVQIAFRDYNFIHGFWGSEWVGLKHFRSFFESPSFWKILSNTLVISVVSLIITFPLPIVLALFLNEIKNGIFKKTTQMVTYAPYFISTVVMSSMIILFLNTSTGELAKIFQFFGLEPINFLSRASDFKYVYAWSNAWQHTGYASIIYLAALAGVNPELYEAAKMDGASRLQKMWNVDIPSMMPVIAILLILAVADLTNVSFEKILLLQNPMNLPSSETIQTYVYKVGIINANFSFSTAIGVFNSVINFILLIVANTVSRKVSENSLW